MFVDGDLENGTPSDFVERLVVIDAEELTMDEIFERASKAVWEVSQLE